MIAVSFISLNAQVITNFPTASGIEKNAFIDASTNFSPEIGSPMSDGVGLIFPRTDLKQFEFILDNVSGFANVPTMFDGMIVYNTATGRIPNTDTYVVPGFYFFYNPEGFEIYMDTGNAAEAVSAGVWRPLATNAWLVGGNQPLENNEPMILGIRPPADPTVDVPAAPIIVYGSVRVNGELVSRPIMHIGHGAIAP